MACGGDITTQKGNKYGTWSYTGSCAIGEPHTIDSSEIKSWKADITVLLIHACNSIRHLVDNMLLVVTLARSAGHNCRVEEVSSGDKTTGAVMFCGCGGMWTPCMLQSTAYLCELLPTQAFNACTRNGGPFHLLLTHTCSHVPLQRPGHHQHYLHTAWW